MKVIAYNSLSLLIEPKDEYSSAIIESIIKDLLNKEEVKSLEEEIDEKSSKEKSHLVQIVFHEEETFYGIKYESFGLEKLEYKADKNIIPILHISVIRHLNLQDKSKDAGHDYRRGHIKRNQYVIDSSIWNYYYSYEQFLLEKENSCDISLKKILDEISDNYDKGFYGLSAAIEYADFQSTLVKHGRLARVDGGHSDAVSPFLFHSETAMQSKIEVLEKRTPFFRKASWRFLLVDDHALNGMTDKAACKIGKVDILKSVLCKCKDIAPNDIQIIPFNKITNKNESIENSKPITIHCVTTIEEARTALNLGWRYDLILLDYKLMKVSKLDKKVEGAEKDDNCIQEYGYHLLEQIKSDYDSHSKGNKRNELLNNKETLPGPNGVYYFMFISAYCTAVQERMRMEGFRTKTDYWFLDRGACPLNTPHLFLYSLKRMVDNRFEMLTNHSSQLYKDIALQNCESVDVNLSHTLISFLSVIFEKDERKRCVLGFNAFLNLRRMYDSVKNDYYTGENSCKSSPLIKSLFPDIPYYSNSFWEHLQNLVYLTAFGTIRQWPEMWEDYIFIKGKLKKAEDKIWKELSEDEKKKNTKPSILIRDYILSLKGMMS